MLIQPATPDDRAQAVEIWRHGGLAAPYKSPKDDFVRLRTTIIADAMMIADAPHHGCICSSSLPQPCVWPALMRPAEKSGERLRRSQDQASCPALQ